MIALPLAHARGIIIIISVHKAGQTELAVYHHHPHGFSDFLKNFQISFSIQ